MKKLKNVLLILSLLGSIQNIIGQEMITKFQNIEGDKSSSPSDFIEFNQKLYFEATTEGYGREIWVTNGNENEAYLLKDINPGKNNALQRSFSESSVIINNTLYFIANDGNSDGEIWKTDGTSVGTEKVTTFLNSSITKLTLIGDNFYFLIQNNYSLQVWISDGTTEGTKIVKENLPISNNPTFQGKCNNTFIFTFQPYGTNNTRVWRSDGTSDGTFPITDEIDGNGSGPGGTSALSQYIEFNNELYFVSRNFLHKTDGTLENTVTMTSLYPTYLNQIDYADVIEINGKLYFSFFKIDDSRLLIYEYDATSGGSKIIYYESSNKYFVTSNLLGIDNNLIFVGVNENGGSSLIKLNLTDYSVTHIKELQDSAEAPFSIFADDICRIKDMGNGNIFCSFPIKSTFEQIAWISGLSNETTNKIEILNWVINLFNFNNSFYFSKFSDLEGYELWKSNGTENGTLLIDNINKSKYGLSNKPLISINSNLIFSANDGLIGEELWKYDGVNTNPLKDIRKGSSSSNSSSFIHYKDEVFFVSNDSIHGKELWKTNGTEEGTTIVSDLIEGEGSSYPRLLTILNDVLYFIIYKDGHSHLCKTNGTNIDFIMDLGVNKNNIYFFVSEMISSGDNLYFVTEAAGTGQNLWVSDGTEAGTLILKDFYSCKNLTEVNGKLFFTAKENYFDEMELWVTDGTTLGTKLVKDIGSGYSSFPNDLINFNGILFFTAFTNESGREIWKSDGTEANTSLLIDLNVGSPNSISTANFNIMNNELYFNANNGELGFELWKTSGTEEGTSLVKDINPGIGSSIPSEIVVVNDLIYFQANDNEHGFELWKSDGTKTGTVLVSDILSGNQSSHPTNITTISDNVFLFAESIADGRQIWKIKIKNDDDDDDDDGILNKNDLCPNTPIGETVNENGCSQSQLDEDEDGIMNDVDLCPDTPTGETVNENGCSQSQLDDDNDGVMNNIDLCPDTLSGKTVDENGCADNQLDDDNDGVTNDLDQCSGTPLEEEVNDVGCALSNSKINIPDANFEQALIDLGIDSDGIINKQISKVDALNVNNLNVSEKEIESLVGIEGFENLLELTCFSNNLKSLDVSKNLKLLELNCYNNQLSSLDLSQNKEIVDLGCSDNLLTELDVTMLSNLIQLSCSNNQLSLLNTNQNYKLNFLHCENNLLVNLNLSINGQLVLLNCSKNLLENLDVTNNTNLTSIYCYDNLLTELDVTKNTKLIDFYCYNNNLTSIDVSKNTKLSLFYCWKNFLQLLDVKNNNQLIQLICNNNKLTSLDVSENGKLENFDCSNNQLTSLVLIKNSKLTRFHCYNNQLTNLDISSCIDLGKFNSTNNLDLSCIQVLNEAAANEGVGNYKEWYKDSSAFYSENCSNPDFDDDGVLNENDICPNTPLGDSVDANGCSVNQIVYIPDPNFEQALIDLGIDSDGIINKQISKIDALNVNSLDVPEKGIKDLSGIDAFENLQYLYCGSNELTNLDLSKNKQLIGVNCTVNQLSSLNISKSNYLRTLSCSDNELTSIDLSNNIQLTYYYGGNNQLTSIDISNNINLEYFHCSNNNLANIDVSKNTKLRSFWCSNNQLSELNVRENIELEVLFCNYNALVNLDVSNNISLTNFQCFNNQISSLDVSNNINLTNFNCSDNQLNSLDVSNNVQLLYLYCDNNQLINIDVRNQKDLASFSCKNNQLTSLDLSNNLKLNYFNSVNNPDLVCIQVDNEVDAKNGVNNYNEWYKDNAVIYSEDCSSIDIDGDGVLDEEDLCLETPEGETVNENGCSQSQLDDDNDGVMNDKDLCPDTLEGALVNFNGCIVLPSNNFKIEAINETCPDKNNGEINIETTESYNYLAIINSNEYSFTDNLNIENLEPGTYNICIIVPNITSKQCYTIEIAEGKTVSGKASTTSNKTTIEIEKGTAPFDVLVNGQLVYKTMSSTFDLNNKHGDLIEIKTAVSCEGVFSKTINLFEEIVVFPNPTKGIFEIALPLSLEQVKIELFSTSSQLISSNIYKVINGKVQLDIRNKPNAMYIVKIHLENPVSVKIIKE